MKEILHPATLLTVRPPPTNCVDQVLNTHSSSPSARARYNTL